MKKITKVIMVLMISLSLFHVSLNEVDASSCADSLVSVAMGESGSSYKSKYGAKPWCASFVSWAARSAGIPTNIIPSTSSSAGMKSSVVSLGGKVVSSPQKGDLVFYKKSANGSICHVAIMTSSTMSIHGNYSKKVTYMSAYDYIDDNGNKTNRSKMIFVRPNYGKSESTDSTENKEISSNISSTTNNNSTLVTSPKPVVQPTVVKTNISEFTVKGIESKVEYTSKAIKPTITLYNGSKKIDSSNYSVTYKNNTNPGKATVTIKGKNDYTGTITKTFTILEVDYSKLIIARSSIPVDLSIYTEDTLIALNSAITLADNLKSTSVQKTVDEVTVALNKAIEGLIIKPADYSALDEVLTKIPEDLSDYTKDTVEALNTAINAVVRDKLITEQQLVDQMCVDIETALTNLKLNLFRSEVVIPVTGCALVLGLGIYMFKKKKKINKAETIQEQISEDQSLNNQEEKAVSL